MRVKINTRDEALYCCDCKEIIEIAEKYAIVTETVLDEKIQKEYHLNCIPVEDDDINCLLDENISQEEIIEDYNE